MQVVRTLFYLIGICSIPSAQNYGTNAENIGDIDHARIFQNLYKRKRGEHKEAVKSIMQYDSVKKYKLIEAIAVKAFEVLEGSQVKLREAGYVPGMDFPADENVREALSLCLENTAFLCEIVLHFPDVTHRILDAKKAWTLILTWGVFFASQSNFLDAKTKQLIYLASQELGLGEEDPNYINPYAKKSKINTNEEESNKKKTKRKKKSFKRGPVLSRNLGEL